MDNFDIATFDQRYNYAIEASAGTGKTHSIIGIVNKIIKDEPDIFKKILIVTYTEKAAGELKNRIKTDVAGVDINDANIYTIHSFCKNTIKEFGVTANLPLNLNLVSELDLKAFTEKYFREGAILKASIALAELGYEVNLNSIKESFIAGISKYYLDGNNNEDEEIIYLEKDEQDFEEMLQVITKFSKAKSLSDLFIDFPEMEIHYNTLKSSELPDAQKMAREIEETYNLCFLVNFSKGKLQKEPLLSAYNYFSDFRKKFGGAKSNREKYSLRLLVACFFKDYFEKWQLEKEYNKLQSFDDMIRCIREALKSNKELKNKLREKYKYGIIDEFQDTNQRQFDIFKTIFMCDNHRIIVVGDPKQSIYAFQGADVNVYNKAKNEIKDSKEAINGVDNNIGKLCSLGKNWRSSDGTVEFAGTFFSRENGFDFGITEFEPSECNHKYNSTYDNELSTSIWVGASSIEGGEITPKEYARIAVEQILAACQKDENRKTRLYITTRPERPNVSFNDFAVLARTRSEMSYIKSEFKKVGIPFIQYKDVTLFKSKECAHWVALLQAVDIPDFTGKNRKIFKKALFTDFFGLDLYEINQSKYDKDDLEEIDLFDKWRNLARKRSWEDLIDSVLNESRLFTVLRELNKSQSFTKIKQLSDYIVDYLYDNHSLKDVIDNLKNLSDGSEEDEDGALVGRGTDFDCVKIMTIHASKGLEFPVVISVAGYKGLNTRGKAFTYHDINGKQVLTLYKETNKNLINEEQKEEFKRIIYVAYTRAKYILMIPHYGEKYNKDLMFLKTCTQSFIDNHQSSYRFVFSEKKTTEKLKNLTQFIIEQNNTSEPDLISKEEQELAIKDFIKEENSKKSYKHSYSSLSHPKEEEEDEDDKEGLKADGLKEYDIKAKQIDGIYDDSLIPMDIPSNFPKGAKIGTALHEVFEKLDYQNYETNMEKVIKEAFNNQLISCNEKTLNIVKEMVDRVLNAYIPEVKGNKGTGKCFKLSELPLKDKKAEMEFNFNLYIDDKNYELLRNYFNGFIDLTFRRGEYFSILDWKSDSLNEDEFLSYNHAHDLKNHVDNAYSIQRVLYAYCLIKWLKIYYKDESEEEIFQNHFGGVYYLFLRGCNKDTSNGVYAQSWNSWKDLKDTFNSIINKKIRRGN